MAGLGLGYLAQGLMAGRQQNIQDSLRRNQETRAQELHAPTLKAAQANANWADNRASEENQGYFNTQNRAAAGLAAFNSSDPVLDATLRAKTGTATGIELGNTSRQQQVDLTGEDLTPEAVAYRAKNRKINSGLLETNFGIAQNNLKLSNEEFSPTAVANRDMQRLYEGNAIERKDEMDQMALETARRNDVIARIKSIPDKSQAQMMLQEQTELDKFETLQRLSLGDKAGALKLFNGLDSNGIYDATDLAFNKQGDLVITRATGEALIYPAAEIAANKALVTAAMRRGAKEPTEPKTLTEKQYDDYGNVISEKPYITKVDHATGRAYKQYLEEEPIDIDIDTEIKMAMDLVNNGELTEDEFYAMYPQISRPRPAAPAKPDRSNIIPERI